MANRRLVWWWWWLPVFACAAIAGFVAVLLTRGPADRNALVLEVGKGLLQLVVIGVLGTLLKLLADAHQAKRLRAEQHAEFWRNKYRRLVEATNKLRGIPVVLPVDPVPATLQRHMLTVLDVASELRVIKHEIFVTDGVQDSPIRDVHQVTNPLVAMYKYADMLASAFEEALIWHRTGNDEYSAWERLRDLAAIKDLLDNPDRGSEEPAAAPTWKAYLKLEICVLRLITAAALGERPLDADQCADKEPIATPSPLTPAMHSPPSS
jgi:hypothetical protein